MSKCHVNWARTPNSKMDRQRRPKQFFRGKDRVEDFERLKKIQQDRLFKICEKQKQEAEAAMEALKKEKEAQFHERTL